MAVGAIKGHPSAGPVAPLYDVAVVQSRGVQISVGSCWVNNDTFLIQPSRLTLRTCQQRYKHQLSKFIVITTCLVPYKLACIYHNCNVNISSPDAIRVVTGQCMLYQCARLAPGKLSSSGTLVAGVNVFTRQQGRHSKQQC